MLHVLNTKTFNALQRIIALLVLSSHLLVYAYTPPMGIHLGATALTSTYIPVDEHFPVPLASILGSDDYKKFMLNAAVSGLTRNQQPSDEIDHVAERIFQPLLLKLHSAAVEKIDDSNIIVNFTSVSVPNYLGSPAKRGLRLALTGHLDWDLQITSQIESSRLAYRLNTCSGLGLDPTCDVNHGYGIMFLDLNEPFLEATLIGSDEEAWGIEDHSHLSSLGTASSIRPDEEWASELENALANFVARTVGSNNTTDSLQAIVLSGEADEGHMKILKRVVLNILPDHEGAIRDTHPYNFVGAIGAAYLSKWQMDKPWEFLLPADPRRAAWNHNEL